MSDTSIALLDQPSYSMRRYFVDEFFSRQVPRIPAGSRVLDLGGNKVAKRGAFDIEKYPLRIVYANLSTAKHPDVQADATSTPFSDGGFDAVICGELLEHVADPLAVLREVHRVLRVEGTLLITVPFIFPIHGDPHDYGRYTDFFWQTQLQALGFTQLEIEKQGLFWSVLAEMMRGLVNEWAAHNWPRPQLLRRALERGVRWGKHRALKEDSRPASRTNAYTSRFTTGFGIYGTKRDDQT